jgi:carbonic anhydrase
MLRASTAVTLYLALLATPTAAQTHSSGAPGKPDIQTRETQAAMTPATALERLRDGNLRFASNASKPRDWSAKVMATASGQFPFAAVLGCMDSRAPIEIVFDQGIGDIFGLRVAGNVVNQDQLGSLEYAVHVGVKVVVVLGHTGCGAVKGAIDGVKLGNLTGLLEKIRPAIGEAGCSDSKDQACVDGVAEANVRQTVKQIRENSPYLRERLDAGSVRLVGGIYDIATGKITFMEQEAVR